MVSFNHLDPGTPEREWETSDWKTNLPALPTDELKRLVVVAAHPDDETLGAGGLMTWASRRGIPVTVIVLSNGEASHPRSPTHTVHELAALRQKELSDAAADVAPDATLLMLNLPDGFLADHVGVASVSIGEELFGGDDDGISEDDSDDRSGVESRVGAEDAFGDGAGIWVVAPWRGDGHPDHAAAGEAAAIAVGEASAGPRLWEYPIWAWHWSVPTSEVWRPGGTVPVHILELSPDELEAKSRAMSRHASQTLPLSSAAGDEPIISPEFAAHFERSFETFIAATALRGVTDGQEPVEGGSLPEPAGPTGEARQVGETRSVHSLDAQFFDDFYEGEPDPWGFETRWYEKRKRDITLASLPRRRFASALELGSSIGVLTAGLADRCDRILSTDIAEQPLTVARKRLAGQPHVTFRQLAFPAEWPMGTFDLIVLSEVGYYNSAEDLERLLVRCLSSLAPDGVLLACHWRHPVDEYPLTGDYVHTLVGRVPELQRTVEHREDDFLLEVFEATPARSVAQREGLIP